MNFGSIKMKVVEKISEVIEKNSFNEFADFDKKIERRERLIQVLFVILSLLVSYNGDSFLHGNLIRLYLIFVLFAMLYYVALPVSIDKYVNALDIAKKQNADNLSSLKNIADTLYTFTEQLADNENSLKSLDEQIANIENSLGAINVEPEFVKVFEWAKSERIAWGKRGDWLRSAILDTVERKGWLQSENLAFAARLDQHRMVLNLNRFCNYSAWVKQYQ